MRTVRTQGSVLPVLQISVLSLRDVSDTVVLVFLIALIAINPFQIIGGFPVSSWQIDSSIFSYTFSYTFCRCTRLRLSLGQARHLCWRRSLILSHTTLLRLVNIVMMFLEVGFFVRVRSAYVANFSHFTIQYISCALIPITIA
jgi:hypothetical protein